MQNKSSSEDFRERSLREFKPKKKMKHFSLCYTLHLKVTGLHPHLNRTATAGCSVSAYLQSLKDPSVTFWTMQRVKYICQEHLKFIGSQILQPRPKSLGCSVSFMIVAQVIYFHFTSIFCYGFCVSVDVQKTFQQSTLYQQTIFLLEFCLDIPWKIVVVKFVLYHYLCFFPVPGRYILIYYNTCFQYHV